MPQSSELAGGAGFTFANLIAARYLGALLTEHVMPGAGGVVTGVAVEQRDFGEPLDDVIVDLQTVSGTPARLSLQCKSGIVISAAASNKNFREIVRDSVTTLRKADFRTDRDRFGAAVNVVAAAPFNTLNDLCEWARCSDTLEHFARRFVPGGNASVDHAAMKDVISTLVNEVVGGDYSEELLYRFLRHFVVIRFDYLHEGSVQSAEAINAVRPALRDADAAQAGALWAALCEIARQSAGRAAQFTRASLVVRLDRSIALAAAASLRGDLAKLSELASDWVRDIDDDVRGTRLSRDKLAQELTELLGKQRFIQLRGLPGCGKSVLLRQSIEASLRVGPVLFLKSDRLEGRSWPSFAGAMGLSSAPLPDLLVEVGTVGTPVLYIDGIDRVEKEHQGIIIDVVRAVLTHPLLENWRIVISLRDAGSEPVRTWLPNLFENGRLATIDVGPLDDEEAEALAKGRPELASLLSADGPVKEIVRRPFFAKVLSQALGASGGVGSSLVPASETDLIDIWWSRGGFNAVGAGATVRQRAIVELASLRVRALSQPISLADISPATIAGLDELIADGVLQTVRVGHSVRFSHDIFFEWALYNLLVDHGEAWPEELRATGEPPVIGRVIELLSQADFVADRAWETTLDRLDKSGLRSQWTRAWLLGPLGAASFSSHRDRYFAGCAAGNFRWLAKALVWFQAEKTIPNAAILDGRLGGTQLKRHEIVRLADSLGWPSDLKTWRRLLLLLRANIAAIPLSLVPDIVVLFEVWENALRGYPNNVSSGWLEQAAEWLDEIEKYRHADRNFRDPEESSRWSGLDIDLENLENAIRSLVLRAAGTRPELITAYLAAVLADEHRSDKVFEEVVQWSGHFTLTHAVQLVDISLLHFRDELPKARFDRLRAEDETRGARRRAAREKPESQRTRADELALAGSVSVLRSSYGMWDWENLAVDRGNGRYFPASPLRQPFHALFQSAPDEALRLVKELSNHAMTAWRQLHQLDPERRGTPIPLELEFPWGKQRFWGTAREYLWARGLWAPKPLSGAYLAMERWALDQLDSGVAPDVVIEKLVRGNEAIAAVGVAVAIALKSQAATDVTLPLFTSQRLWNYDLQRKVHDLGERGEVASSLIGFWRPSDLPHAKAVQALNALPFRQAWLREYLVFFLLPPEGPLAKRARQIMQAFAVDLPYEYEEQKSHPATAEAFLKEGKINAEFGKEENLKIMPVPDKATVHQVLIDNPLLRAPDVQQRLAHDMERQSEQLLWFWAHKSLEAAEISQHIAAPEAVSRAKKIDSATLFKPARNRDFQELDMQRAAVAGVAAVILKYPAAFQVAEADWARDVIWRAARMPEEARDGWFSGAAISWHSGISAARGLGFELLAGRGGKAEQEALLRLVAHPLEGVSLTALQVSFDLWENHARLGWCALWLSLALCHISTSPIASHATPFEPGMVTARRAEHVKAAVAHFKKANFWPLLPPMPPAWIDAGEEAQNRWRRPDIDFDWGYGAKVTGTIPAERVLVNPEARASFMAFLEDVLKWLLDKMHPPWKEPGHRGGHTRDVGQFDDAIARLFAKSAPSFSTEELDRLFLDAVLALEGDLCYELLAPFMSLYVCVAIYDAAAVPDNAVEILAKCLDRVLKDPTFRPGSYRDGEIHGHQMPRIIGALTFISAEAGGAARFANGVWTDIALVMPLIDRLVRAAGFSVSVMSDFLTLVERAQATYPAEAFADQTLAVLDSGRAALKGWRSLVLPARVAGLVQAFAFRETPMPSGLAQKLLRILDILVDMGDRRSAALQISDSFREVRLS